MTNSYDVDHGLSQDAPGPLGLEAPDDTLARTGNTARDQEMYAAGRAVGEENAKHNAAIRGGVPDGWKLVPIKPTEAMLDAGCRQHRCEQGDPWYPSHDLDEGDCRDIYAAMLNAAPTSPDAPLASMARAIFGDQIGGQMDAMTAAPSLSSLHGFAPGACDGMKSEDYVNKVRNDGCSLPDCAAPASPVSTVEDAGAQKVVIDFDQVGSAGPFHVIYGRATIPAVTVMDLVRMASPAAGDARDAERYRWLCDKFGITKLPCAIERIIDGSYVADGKKSIDAAIDAAIAAQPGVRHGDQ
ncbi:hypothetical protein ACOTJF_18140 [Achromobacter ruhlandii]|uniref:hypothetical protein n=1 Tax=Achromobacter ruhlandii TaxID=72557 RepID=UPI003B9E9BAF